MSNTPIYAAQGGGRLYWKVTSAAGDYSNQLASITGLTKRVDYNGGLYWQEATIQIAGGGLFTGDGVGTVLNISLVDAGGTVLTGWGDYTITAFETIGASVKITAQPRAKFDIAEDFNWYEFKPWQPRRYAQYWLDAAMQGRDIVKSIPFHAGATPRSEAKVVAPASTLKGLSGLRGPAGQDTCATTLQLGDEHGESSWTGTTRSTTLPPAFDAEVDLAPAPGALLGSTPLFWHYIGGYFTATAIARMTNTGSTSSDKCQFPLGIVQYLKIGLIWHGSSTISLSRNKPETAPDDVQDVTLTFPTRAEAKQYLAEAAAVRPSATPLSPFGKSTRQGLTADGAFLRRNIGKGGKTVTIVGYAVYKGIAARWYDQARAAIAPTATKPNNAAPGEEIELEGVVYSTTAAVIFPTPAGLFAANVHFLPQEADADWRAMGLTSLSALRPAYKWQQDLYPVTIAQDYTTKEHFAESCMLGHIGFFNGAAGIKGAELCSEQGTVFGLALDIHTAVTVENGPGYAIPREIWINFRDQYAVNRSYKYSDPGSWLTDGQADAMTLNLCQGVIQPETVTTSNGKPAINLNGNNWSNQPGLQAVRLHGSDWSTASGINVLASSSPLGGLQGPDGHYYPMATPSYSSLSTINSYGVRTKDGTQWRPFVGNMYLYLDNSGGNAYNLSAESGPLVDAFNVNQWAEANARIYSENKNHKAFIVQTTMAFASAEPGDVVAVQLPQIFDGSKMLATVLAVEVDSSGTCKLEIVPMHTITAADYSAYSNLAGVLP